MAINSIENVSRYSEELDRMFAQKSATGFFADNNLAAKFVGAKTVMIPDIDFQGLADYDRDTGFSRGAITVSNTPYTMGMDRARSLQIDREDMDESGIATLAGKILGEYVRTKVVPECDAYVLSKLAGVAASRGNTIVGRAAQPLDALFDLISAVRGVVGYDEELVAFIDSGMYAALQSTAELTRMLSVTEFKQGDIDLRMYSINGVTLIPVVPERMKTAYTFNNTASGGFTPLENAREVYMMVCPKKGAHLVKKTEQMRIFTPEQNLDADAYKFDYRIYYDVFVQKSGLDSIWAWISPVVNITAQPSDVTVTEGSITGNLTASATISGGAVAYQWYKAEDAEGNGAVKVAGGTTPAIAIPTDLEAGEHYFFVNYLADSIAATRSRVATVTVNPAD